jgi:hypothetical protein
MENKNGTDKAIYLLLLPFVLITMLCCAIGYKVAQKGGTYRMVSFVTFPAAFFLTQFFGGAAMLCLSFAIFLFTTSGSLVHTVVNGIWVHFGDLSLFHIWGRVLSVFYNSPIRESEYAITIPWQAILLYQSILFVTLGYRFSRHITMTTMDIATAVSARRAGLDPFPVWEKRVMADRDYQQATIHYIESNKPPFMAVLILVVLRIWPTDVYRYMNWPALAAQIRLNKKGATA